MLPLWVRVSMAVMAMKKYSTHSDILNWSLSIRCSFVSYSVFNSKLMIHQKLLILSTQIGYSYPLVFLLGLYIYIYIYVWIIKLRYQYGFPSLFIVIRPYHQSLPSGLLDDIQYPHRAAVSKFLLVGKHWIVCVNGSIGERRLWIRLYFSSSVLHVLLVLFKRF